MFAQLCTYFAFCLCASILGAFMALYRRAVLRARKSEDEITQVLIAADNQAMRLLTEIGDMALKHARLDTICQAWMSYAIGYEVFCEATFERDEVGIVNAGTEIAKARKTLQSLGQYDA